MTKEELYLKLAFIHGNENNIKAFNHLIHHSKIDIEKLKNKFNEGFNSDQNSFRHYHPQ